MKYINILFCLAGLLFNKAYSQEKPDEALTLNLDHVSFDQFVKEVERQSGYRFYYDTRQTDSLFITINQNNITINQALRATLTKTAYHYVITSLRQVVITMGISIIKPGIIDSDTSSLVYPNNAVTILNVTTPVQKLIPVNAGNANLVYDIGLKTNNLLGKASVAGYIHDMATGTPIVGATIIILETNKGVATDKYGFYSLTASKGQHTLLIRSLGNKDAQRRVMLYADGIMNIDLEDQVTALREVKISSDKVANVKGLEMGVNRLDIKTIKEIPAVFGEADVLRSVLVLPGVQTVGEATTGFNVRGGSADQNLILLNDAVIYNPAHFFGFFSAFNPDIIKDVELYKNTIPEKFGGRLSSVLDVNDREGNQKQFSGTAGIGLLTSRVSLEGPLLKDKTSFIFGGRTTYSNWLLALLPQSYKNSRASFYDLNLDISHKINTNNYLYGYGYISNDNFKLNGDTAYSYSNKSIGLKWKHNFSNKLNSITGIGYNRYQYNITSTENPVNAYQLRFNINESNFRSHFNYYLNSNHTVNFGVSGIFYALNQGDYEPEGTASLAAPNRIPRQQALESALYIGDQYDITDKLALNVGIRYSFYGFLGPYTVSNYNPDFPKSDNNRLDTTKYGANQLIKTYSAPEFRLAIRYLFSTDFSVKAAYNTLHQYLHLLTNSTAISPTDVYQLSDPNIRPQYGDQVSLGIYKNLDDNTIETSVEGYYKRIKNYLDYKSGAVLVLNRHIETDVVNTQGKAYGIEFFLRKKAGKLNGMLSYAYSRTFLKQDDNNTGELINNGDYYPANFDKPNSFNLIGNYRVSHRFSLSLNVTYSTGRPITLPITKYNYGGSDRVYYSDRNAYRVPDYFRTDFSVNVEGNHVVKQRLKSSFTFGVYNLTGEQNAYSTYFSSRGGAVSGYQLSIFAAAIPFVNYNLKF